MSAFPVPAAAQDLTEPESVAIAQQIQLLPIVTPLAPEPIQTAVVHRAGREATALPILLLHGFDSSLLEYRRLLPQLPAAHPVWAVDLWGFGFTERHPDGAYHPGAIKTHLAHFWQTQIQRPMILVGASMGGAAAIDFTLTYPERVAQLVLIDSAGIPDRPWTWRFMMWPLDHWATAFLRNPQVRAHISRTAYFDATRVTPDANCCAALHVAMPDWDRALINFTRSGGYGTFLPQLSRIQTPTLIVWGEQDRILGTKDALLFAQHLPQSQLVWIAQAGHVPHLEQAPAVADAIAQFSHQYQPFPVA